MEQDIPEENLSVSTTKDEEPQGASEEEKINRNEIKRCVTFLLPMTIPGTGKTMLKDTIISQLETPSNQIKFLHLSSDDIRAELIETRMEELGESRDTAFDRTAKPAKTLFDQRLSEIVEEIIRDKENISFAVYIDKNILPNQFNGLKKQFSKFESRLSKEDITSRITLVLPK